MNPIGGNEWEEIEVAVDSGTIEDVMSLEALVGVQITFELAFVRGVKYEVGNGEQIHNLGERKFVGHMGHGSVRSLTAQVCAANNSLMSVIKIARVGHRVIFDSEGSYIEDKSTKERIWMTEDQGMYTLKMWVSRKHPTRTPVFTRQGKRVASIREQSCL